MKGRINIEANQEIIRTIAELDKVIRVIVGIN